MAHIAHGTFGDPLRPQPRRQPCISGRRISLHAIIRHGSYFYSRASKLRPTQPLYFFDQLVSSVVLSTSWTLNPSSRVCKDGGFLAGLPFPASVRLVFFKKLNNAGRDTPLSNQTAIIGMRLSRENSRLRNMERKASLLLRRLW